MDKLTKQLDIIKNKIHLPDITLSVRDIKINTEINPACRLCAQTNETLYHFMTDCKATSMIQLDIIKTKFLCQT